MASPDAPLPRLDARLAALLRVAAQLRDLPRQDFKSRLKAELLSHRVEVASVRASKGDRARRKQRTGPAARRVSPIPEGYGTATTCLIVKDAPRAIEFYRQAFGATELMRLADPAGKVMHAEVQIGDSRIAIADEAPEYNLSPQSLGGSPAIISLYVDDVDAVAGQAVAAGAKMVFPVADQFYGDRSGRLQDPFGHLWIIATHVEDVSPEETRKRAEAWAKEAAKEQTPTAGRPVREGFHSITPYLQVRGAAGLIDFLRQAFGAKEMFRTARPDGTIAHAEVRLEGSMVELAEATSEFQPTPTAIHLYVKDTDAAYRRALKAGATSIQEPTDQDYGERSASVKDSFGNHWYIATPSEGAEPLPEELHSVTPYLHPKGAGKVIDFLKQAFGAEEVFRAQDPGGTIHHAKVRIGDSILEMGEAHGPYQPMPPALHLYVPDTDATYQSALRAGASSLYAPADQPYGERSGGVKDPFGNVWYIATHKKDVTGEEAVEHKAGHKEKASGAAQPKRESPPASMALLYVRDATKALEFYKKVFGATELMRKVQPDGTVSHAQLQIGDLRTMIRDAGTEDLAEYQARGYGRTPRDLGGTSVHLYLYVKDADAAFRQAIGCGAKAVDPVEDQEWGDRCGGVQDPFGHIWYIATPIQDLPH